jgi:hypothetical protein
MNTDELVAVWHRVLPFLRNGINDGLREAGVSFVSNVTIDDWIHAEPSLAVYWDMPSRSNWRKILGRSVSTLLIDFHGIPRLKLWGASWQDDWESRERSVANIFFEELDISLAADERAGAPEMSAIVDAVIRAIITVQGTRPTFDQVVPLGDDRQSTTALVGTDEDHRKAGATVRETDRDNPVHEYELAILHEYISQRSDFPTEVATVGKANRPTPVSPAEVRAFGHLGQRKLVTADLDSSLTSTSVAKVSRRSLKRARETSSTMIRNASKRLL